MEYARDKALADRLLRGEELEYAEAGARTLDANTLILGEPFAWRMLIAGVMILSGVLVVRHPRAAG